MTSAAATYSGAHALDVGRVVPGHYRRAIRRGAGIGVGTLTAAGTASAVTLTAAWMIAAAMSAAPHLPGLGNAPAGLSLGRSETGFAGRWMTDFSPGSVNLSPLSPSRAAERIKSARLDAVRRVPFPSERFALTPTNEGDREAAAIEAQSAGAKPTAVPENGAAPPSGYVAATFDLLDPQPTWVASLPRTAVAVTQTTTPRSADNNAASPTRQVTARAAAPLILADAEANPVLPPMADAAPARHSTLTGFLRKLFGRQVASADPDITPALGSRTAIYDIEAGIVYLPDGEKLEAHSGLGSMMDDPHYISRKGRGPTPPNVYNLALREGLFHGVQAIRLKPVNDDKMYGRDGILAHPYMLGASGQSFGCVSFKDYPRFLKAVENGQVDRMVVVPYRGDYQRYAAND
ncbi:MAG: tlde1 domain-containing protein [Xanthobacteraceae bacterium]